MIIRLASTAEAEEVMRLRREAAEWLCQIGSDQWSSAGINDDEFRRRVRESINADETWVAVDEHGQVLGTIAIDTQTNPGLWTEEERKDSLFVHRMIKDRSAPSGVGTELLRHAEKIAAQRGARFLRLDAWTTNAALHGYYQSAGFEHVRTVAEHHTSSSALFARRIDDSDISG